jgi:glycyl-tRNA synthetase
VGIDELFTVMLPLVEPINTFFDDVLVMHEDRELRENRLALLQRIAKLPRGIVDLSKVMGF